MELKKNKKTTEKLKESNSFRYLILLICLMCIIFLFSFYTEEGTSEDREREIKKKYTYAINKIKKENQRRLEEISYLKKELINKIDLEEKNKEKIKNESKIYSEKEKYINTFVRISNKAMKDFPKNFHNTIVFRNVEYVNGNILINRNVDTSINFNLREVYEDLKSNTETKEELDQAISSFYKSKIDKVICSQSSSQKILENIGNFKFNFEDLNTLMNGSRNLYLGECKKFK